MLSALKGVVFVADDEDALRESTQDVFEDAGYLVLSARSGSEALARMRVFSGPAVAVIDLVMPGMDGWQLIEAVRGDTKLAHIAIIVVTAHAACLSVTIGLRRRRPSGRNLWDRDHRTRRQHAPDSANLIVVDLQK